MFKINYKKLMQELLLKILIYLVVAFISIVIIATNTILGGLIILAFTFLKVIPSLVDQILNIKKNIDN